MTKLAEQSKVPRVLTRKTVGTPAFAVTTLGEYPPFAVMSINCLPSTIETADCPVVVSLGGDFGDAAQKAQPISTAVIAREAAIFGSIV